MNSDPSKLRQQHQQAEQAVGAHLQADAQKTHEFNSVEEMIRFDADQNPPPEELAERVKESISREPPPRRSWWRRLFGS